MSTELETLQAALIGWPGISTAPHRFGGVEYQLNGREVGHVHRGGMVDIPFLKVMAAQLIAEGKAQPHHLLKDSGWISYYIRGSGDVAGAVWLFRLAYLHTLSRLQRQGKTSLPEVDFARELAQLGASEPLQALIMGGGRQGRQA